MADQIIQRARIPCRGDLVYPPRWMEIMQTYIETVDPTLNRVDPAADPSQSGGTSITVTIVGAAGGVPVPNTMGLIAGEFVNIVNGVAQRASYDVITATHCVGLIVGDIALCYAGWGEGPVAIDNLGTGRILWLGQNGRASRQRPPVSVSGSSNFQQNLGATMQSTTGTNAIRSVLIVEQGPYQKV